MENEEFIPGIYNYCDRWCERCDFTSRCRVFFEEKKQIREAEDKDNFLEIVSKNFEETIKLLYKIAEEKNIDLDNIEIDEDEYQEHLEKREEARNHPLVKLAQNYTEDVTEWLDKNKYLEEENSKFLKNIDLGIDLEQSDKALRLIEEALNIINWYKFQLQVKLASAVRSYPHDPLFEDEIQNRHHMSAKIALIGVKNSMKAWQSLLEILDDEKGEIIDILLQLHQLQTKINNKFPLLPNFKRPGFDD
jgi:hypothetical protein